MTAAESLPIERAVFIRQTYLLLAGEIAAFIGLEVVIFDSGIWPNIFNIISSWSLSIYVFIFTFLLIFAVFCSVFIIAKKLVNSESSKAKQYFGLGFYVLTEAIIFSPVLYFLENKGGLGLILEAGIITFGLFSGITAVAFLTRKDFSFLLPILIIGVFLFLGVFISGLIFGFSVRSFVSFMLVAMAGGWILYRTSEILHRYQPHQYIQASLSLFHSITWLFWLILRSYSLSSRKDYSNHLSNS